MAKIGMIDETDDVIGFGRFVLTAADATQFAWEADKILGETDNSLFTHFLVKGLEGEADSDGDGRITIDELYDYAYTQISKVAPKQTPTKSSSRQEGEIVLRQNMRIEDIKPIPLPDDLVNEIEDLRPYVREAAVQKLEKILKGKNIGLKRSAIVALERIIADENTTGRVAQLAKQALEVYQQVEPKSENERKTKEEAQSLATQKAEGEIVLSQISSTEDIKPVALPDHLISEIENLRPFVREAAVQRLIKVLHGKNIGLRYSAIGALEKIVADENTTHRVAQLAKQALESYSQEEQKAEEERKAKEEAEQLAILIAEEERLAREKAETEKDDIQKLVEYTNAKVVLVGDTGVGKSGLALALTNQPFVPTESTHGRRVLRFDIKEVETSNNRKVIQETILWDLAGQPGYRLIHQLDLQDIAVAIIVFDARSEVNPFSGVSHWLRALQQIDKSKDDDSKLAKFLVVARVDRGSINMSRDQINQFVKKNGFQGYFETSAREGLNIAELSEAIRQAIRWSDLVTVSSNLLFERIKNFINEEKLRIRILSTKDDLFRAFSVSQKEVQQSKDLRDQFDICLQRIESLDIVRLVNFGNFVLLQPEILASYSSALINTVKSDPEGLGSIPEENAREGLFSVPKDERIRDHELEKILLIAMIGDLLKHEIALREGSDLVFPTQLTRENLELSNQEGEEVVFRFEGPVVNIYATLIVRLTRSVIFKKKELWKNAATFTSRTRGLCGISLIDHEDGRGEFKLFFDSHASEETRLQFEEYIRTHIERFAVKGTINRERLFICDQCKTKVDNIAVVRRRERGFKFLYCQVCDPPHPISLLDGEERLSIKLESRIDEIDEFADAGRRREIKISVLQGKIESQDFDVFLCHNSQDKPEVKKIGGQLRTNGILPWLDEWELRPGLPWQRLLEEQISKIKAAAVFVGPNGVGPWQRNELDAFLRAFVDRGCPVIPVLLPTAPKVPELPIFLQSMTWVDFRKRDPEPLERLIWGITGERIMI